MTGLKVFVESLPIFKSKVDASQFATPRAVMWLEIQRKACYRTQGSTIRP